MPPSAGTRGLTAEQKILYQKERNKLKQRTLRARRKAAKESGQTSAAAAAGDDSILIASSTSNASSCSTPSSSSTTKRVKKSFTSSLEPGEGGFMMKARRAVGLKAEEEQERRRCEREGGGGGGEGSGGSSSSGSSGSGMKAAPISSTAPRGSDSLPTISVPSSKSKSKLTSVSLFATLLNGGSLPPPSSNASPSHLSLTPAFPPSTSSSSSSSNHHHHQLALQHSSSEPTLPSYTYFSPANIGSFPLFNPLNSIDWKWRLFQIHSSLYEDRDHPTKGYLHSSFADETIATAQTLILQLLAATSPPGRKEILDARRQLSSADEQFLKVTPMDRRIGWMPDPLVRVNAMKAISCGLDFTEKAAAGIETATIFGDAMDSGAWMLQNKVALDTRNLYLVPSVDEAGCERNPSLLPGPGSGGKKLHGASVREIVLGLELPGARTDQPLTQPASMTDEELARDWSLDWVMGKKMEGVLKTAFQF